MDDKDILGILNELDADDKAREARMRGRARIRQVIMRYLEILQAMPQVEVNLAAAQKTYKEVTDRLNEQMASLRSQVADARGALTAEKETLEKEHSQIVLKRTELQKELTKVVSVTEETIKQSNTKRAIVEQALEKAEIALEEFRKKHLVNINV